MDGKNAQIFFPFGLRKNKRMVSVHFAIRPPVLLAIALSAQTNEQRKRSNKSAYWLQFLFASQQSTFRCTLQKLSPYFSTRANPFRSQLVSIQYMVVLRSKWCCHMLSLPIHWLLVCLFWIHLLLVRCDATNKPLPQIGHWLCHLLLLGHRWDIVISQRLILQVHFLTVIKIRIEQQYHFLT